MAWIKRNLFFVIGGLVALGMLGWAGYYNYTRWHLDVTTRAALEAKYDELVRLNNLHPHPGNKQVDNIQAAKDQQQEVRAVLARASDSFQPIAAIPPSTNVTSQDFATSLRQTIDQMQRDAYNASVLLPRGYNFSFEAERQKVLFAAGSLAALAVQLGEVKAICDILDDAKVNSLNTIRRERVSADDQTGPAADYTALSSETNELAILTPYEVTFQCFSPELAAVLAGFASSPHGMIVKSLNVESASSNVPVNPSTASVAETGDPAAQSAPGAPRLGAANVLNEKQLRITLLVEVVKLLPRK